MLLHIKVKEQTICFCRFRDLTGWPAFKGIHMNDKRVPLIEMHEQKQKNMKFDSARVQTSSSRTFCVMINKRYERCAQHKNTCLLLSTCAECTLAVALNEGQD